jgi:dienelactone hydrolase
VSINDEVRLPSVGIVLVALTMMVCASPAVSAEPRPVNRQIPWDVSALSKTPKVHPATERPANGMRSFFYEGADYKGKPAWVFAYYAAPAGTPPAGGWPAAVCAHGGGGTAYPGWVRAWNGHGYAAIVMDLEGHLPGGKDHGMEGNLPIGAGHQNAGPKRIGWFGDIALPDKEQWFYHAVADVIRANSLLRSFPEINPKKIGLTGISWGGTIVSTVAGVDSRFAFVIPVYGCGFIHKHDMTPDQYREYLAKWDPSAHLPSAKMPMLWVTGVADPVFQVDIFAKSAKIAGGPSSMCLRPFLAHGHGNGWEDAGEIYTFADNIVKGGPPLPKLERPEFNPATGIARTKYTGGFTEAWVYFTTSGGNWQGRKWNFIQCNVSEKELVARQRLPNGTTAFLIYGFKVNSGSRSNHAASDLVVLK